jgi:hypothetical protein
VLDAQLLTGCLISVLIYNLQRVVCFVTSYENSTFSNMTVDLDGVSFRNCVFQGCALRYSGGEPPTMVDCNFYRSRFEFAGAASDTLSFMRAIYHGMGDGGKKLIEGTFASIKERRAGVPSPNQHENVDG